MARSRSNDSTAHSYWIKTLNEARNNARQAITRAEAWGLSPEMSVGPVDVEEMSKPQKIMAQTHSYTLDYFDHLAPWKSRHEDLFEKTIYKGLGPTGEFETFDQNIKHIGTETVKDAELDTLELELQDVPNWRMKIITLNDGPQQKRYKLYLPAGACHAIYHQLMNLQNKLNIAADVGPVIPHEEDVGVLTHDDVDYATDYDDYGGGGQ